MNRITAATGGASTNYDVSGISYDKNGNILTLNRKGHTNVGATSFGDMDILSYSYDSGNKLTKVADAAPIDQFGFKDDAVNQAADTADDYTYDANGNMVSDTNKGITAITYNHLNLPVQVTFASGNIQYFYSADGAKQKKVVSTGIETLYAGNYIYEGTTGNAQLQFFNHPEGYAMPKDVNNYSAGFDYVYNYVDHLNNIRLSYTDANNDGSVDTSEIVKENNYYPFGLKIRGYNENIPSLGNSVAKRYMFGGKEYQEEFNINWYDVTARNYDPAIGRWMNLDPLAEQMRRHSPYNYAFDNPVYFIDYDGMAPSGPGDPPSKWEIFKMELKETLKTIGNDIKETFDFKIIDVDVEGKPKKSSKDIDTSLRATDGKGNNPTTDGSADNHHNVDGLLLAGSFAKTAANGGLKYKATVTNVLKGGKKALSGTETGGQAADATMEQISNLKEPDTTYSVTTYSLSDTEIVTNENGEKIAYGDPNTRDTTTTKDEVQNVKEFEKNKLKEYDEEVRGKL